MKNIIWKKTGLQFWQAFEKVERIGTVWKVVGEVWQTYFAKDAWKWNVRDAISGVPKMGQEKTREDAMTMVENTVNERTK